MWLIVAVAISTLLLARLAWFIASGWRIDQHLRVLPSPPGHLPLLGHALQMMRTSPFRLFAKWGSMYHGLCYFNAAGTRYVYMATPALIKRVLLTNVRNYGKDLSSFKQFMCLLGTGLVTSNGDKWRKGRLLLSHAMRIDVLELIPTVTLKATEHMLRHLADAKEPVDISEEFRHLTLKVIGQSVLSLSADECDRIFPRLYLPIAQECNERVWAPWRAFMPWLAAWQAQRRCVVELDAILVDLIRKRWALRQEERQQQAGGGSGATASFPHARREDILDRCMSQLTECTRTIEIQLRDDIKTILLAGHETSAAALTWATVEVLKNPALAERLKAENTAVFGAYQDTIRNGEPNVPLDVCRQLSFAPACLREALRRYNVVPLVMREALADDEIPASETGLSGPLVIPRGARVAIGIECIHMDPTYFPDPERYDPNRFVDMDKVDLWSFIPFINGPRNCLGQHLSLLETQMVLSQLFGRLGDRLKLVTPPDVASTKHPYIVPVVPKDGVFVTCR